MAAVSAPRSQQNRFIAAMRAKLTRQSTAVKATPKPAIGTPVTIAMGVPAAPAKSSAQQKTTGLLARLKQAKLSPKAKKALWGTAAVLTLGLSAAIGACLGANVDPVHDAAKTTVDGIGNAAGKVAHELGFADGDIKSSVELTDTQRDAALIAGGAVAGAGAGAATAVGVQALRERLAKNAK